MCYLAVRGGRGGQGQGQGQPARHAEDAVRQVRRPRDLRTLGRVIRAAEDETEAEVAEREKH